ncbi:hypothetical protein [Ochrobactrum soli]|uniref:Uncharacterized protein n=1 Tax=Ochrobactrum soli TaxID=2448455 RepID=A0A849KZC0_9HYPH|nr:hypothetical protein [[Ochrobactrum] soli]NNU62272.1 hypothetical protein [[Ochrobactrum] soli]
MDWVRYPETAKGLRDATRNLHLLSKFGSLASAMSNIKTRQSTPGPSSAVYRVPDERPLSGGARSTPNDDN